MTKTEWWKMRASKADLAALRSVAETLALPASATVWFLVHEKQRELDKQSQPRGTASKKSRRRAA
jgi:hypothetical protein